MTAAEAGAASPLGWRIERLSRVDSTNEEARRRALAGDRGRLWVVATEQTEGRGRRGRFWRSPPGNLYASALLIDPSPAEFVAQMGFVAGVALRAAVDDLAPDNQTELKWPNDLVWRGAKLAGVLVEGTALGDGRAACVVGLGVNCMSAPSDLAYRADHLSRALGFLISSDDLFARIAPRFCESLAIWRRGAGFAEIRQRWLAHAAGLGARIRLAGAQGLREGTFETLDERGRLALRGADGVELVEAGDLFLDGDGGVRAATAAHSDPPPGSLQSCAGGATPGKELPE